MTKSKKIISIVLSVTAIMVCLTFGISAFASSATVSLNAPLNLKATMQTDGTKLAWSSVSNASEYEVYWISYSDMLQGKNMTLIGTAPKNSYVDKQHLNVGGSYAVLAKKDATKSTLSERVLTTNNKIQLSYSSSAATITKEEYKFSGTSNSGIIYLKKQNTSFVHTQNLNSGSYFLPKSTGYFGLTKIGYELTGWNLCFITKSGSLVNTQIQYSPKDKLSAYRVYNDYITYLSKPANSNTQPQYEKNPFAGDIVLRLVANWEPITYKISYNLNGGSLPNGYNTKYSNIYINNPNQMTYNTKPAGCNSDYFHVDNPTKPGFAFLGWTITGMDDSTHYYYASSAQTFTGTSILTNTIGKPTLFKNLRGIKGTVKFTANWQAYTYTITYRWNNNATACESQKYTLNDRVSYKAVPKVTGYTTTGWYTNSGCTTRASRISDKYYGNITLYAKKTPIKYKVNYRWADTNSTISMSSKYTSRTYGTGLTLPSVPKKDYYKIEGWFSSKESTNGKITSISSSTIGNVTVYARRTAYRAKIFFFTDPSTSISQEKANTYAINSEGALKGANTTAYYYRFYDSDKTNKTISEAEFGLYRTGYRFNGWKVCYYDKTNGKVDIGKLYKAGTTLPLKTISKDILAYIKAHSGAEEKYAVDLTSNDIIIALYADWTPIKYTITYAWGDNCGTDSGKIINTISPTSYAYRETVTFGKLPTQEGYTIDGWFLDKACTQKAPASTANSGKNYVLFAKKTPTVYTITYRYVMPNGTIGTYTDLTPNTFDVTKETVLPTPTVPSGVGGLTDGKWYTNPACTSAVATKVFKGTIGDKVYYTKTAKSYFVKYYVDGNLKYTETCAVNKEYTYKTLESVYTLPTGYKFSTTKWYEKSDLTGNAYEPGAKYSNLSTTDGGTISLYTKTAPIIYYVKYYVDGKIKLTVTCKYNTTYTFKTMASVYTLPTGYKFSASTWNTNSSITGTTYTPNTSYKNLTTTNGGIVNLYVKTEIIKYSATLQHWMTGLKNNEGTNSAKTAIVIAQTTKTFNYGANLTIATTDHLTSLPNGLEKSSVSGKYKTGTSYEGSWQSYDLDKTFTTPNKDGTFELYYRPIDYTITYDYNGGTAPATANPTTYNVIYGASFTNKPTKTGYTFDGWVLKNTTTKVTGFNTSSISASAFVNNTTTNATTGTFADALKSRTTGAKTVVAQWKVTTYTGSFVPNGGKWYDGSTNVKTAQYTINSKLAVPTTISRVGYIFNGWKVTSAAGNWTSGKLYTSNTLANTTGYYGNPTFTAQWTPITYTVKYNGNGATSGTMAASGHTYDVAKNLTANAFKREFTVTYNYNYGSPATTTTATAKSDFAGWATTSSGTKAYNDGQSVTNLASTQNAVVNLYAKWTNKSVTLPTLTRTGYTFKGWYTAASGGTRVGSGGTSYTPTSTITLYAQWEVTTYTASFDVDEAEGRVNFDLSYTYFTQLSNADNVDRFSYMHKTGFVFAGWKVISTNGNWSVNRVYTGDQLIELTGRYGNVSFKAYFRPIKITLNGNGGTLGTSNVYYQVYGTKYSSDESGNNTITSVSIPTKTGYIFSGYKYSTAIVIDENGNLITNINNQGNYKYFTRDSTVNAQWTAITYQVKYNGNGATSGTMANSTHTYVSQYSSGSPLTANSYKREFTVTYNYNYGNPATTTTDSTESEFIGWATTSTGEKVYNDRQNAKNLASTQGAVVNLYAKWVDKEVVLPTLTRDGYVFDGWYTAASGGTKVGNGGAYYIPTSNVTLYARWLPNS